MTYTDAYFGGLPDGVDLISPNVAVNWKCGENHAHSIGCLWVWHDCPRVLGDDSVMPGARYGWCPSGVGAHTLVSEDPLTITASVLWPSCCGLHGFITDGRWLDC